MMSLTPYLVSSQFLSRNSIKKYRRRKEFHSSRNMTDLGIHSATHSRSSSGSDEIKQATQLRKVGNNQRTESPDTDSAFCDNLSVLSSCSTASSSKTGQSCQLPSSVPQLSKEEQEARIKAEKIKIAIEKIKEAS